jgi:hypothetical protein
MISADRDIEATRDTEAKQAKENAFEQKIFQMLGMDEKNRNGW